MLAAFAVAVPAQAGEGLDALVDEYNEAYRDWRTRSSDTQKEEAAAETRDPPPHPLETYLPRFESLADKYARRSDAIPVLAWIVTNANRHPSRERGKAAALSAFEQLTQHHAADPALKGHLSRLRYAYYRVGAQPAKELFERVIASNPDKDAGAWATFNLGLTLYRDHGATDADKKKAIDLFKTTVNKYPDTSAANQAKGFVYEAEHLQIGMTAPEIVGTDVEGNEIRLSQFRGQVVVLDFWGFW
jgi:hypothetical protein